MSSSLAGTAGVTLCVLRSEEHTSELQSHSDLVCRLLLEKKNRRTKSPKHSYARQGLGESVECACAAWSEASFIRIHHAVVRRYDQSRVCRGYCLCCRIM